MRSPLRGKIKLIALTGFARSGKDTLAQALSAQFGYQQFSFAEPLYKMLNALPYLGHLNNSISTEEKEKVHFFYGVSPRRLLQTLGTEWGRHFVDTDIWVRVMQSKLEMAHRITTQTAFVISDLRFFNEAIWVKALDGICVRIDRRLEERVTAHVSENGISPELIDEVVDNNSTVEALHEHAAKLDDLAEQRRTAARSVTGS